MTAAPTLPVSPILRRQVEDALHAWASAASAVGVDRCWWQDGEPARTTFPCTTLSWVSTTNPGIDANAVEDLDPTLATPEVKDIRLHATGRRRVVVSVQVFADPKAGPEASAFTRLEAAIAGLGLATHRGALFTAGFGFISAGDIRRIAAGQVSCDVVGNVSSAVSEDIFSIKTIGFTAPEPDLDMIDDFTVDADDAP